MWLYKELAVSKKGVYDIQIFKVLEVFKVRVQFKIRFKC